MFTKATNRLGPIMANVEPHLKVQIELKKKGIMFGAGPFFADNESDWNGEGIVTIRAASLDEAQKIAASGPMHASGACSFTLRPWPLNEGTVTIKASYADGARELI